MLWSKEYETGDLSVDREHREIFRLVQQVIDTKALIDKDAKIKIALGFLSEYTVTHFANEEKLMIESDYPGYEEHKAIHDTFIKDVVVFVTRFKKEGASDAIYDTIHNFIIAWLKEHIIGKDKHMADHYIKWTNGQ